MPPGRLEQSMENVSSRSEQTEQLEQVSAEWYPCRVICTRQAPLSRVSQTTSVARPVAEVDRYETSADGSLLNEKVEDELGSSCKVSEIFVPLATPVTNTKRFSYAYALYIQSSKPPDPDRKIQNKRERLQLPVYKSM